MSGMDDLVQFLRDRLDEAQAQQENPFTAWHSRDCEAVPDVWGREPGACTCGTPARVLREVEAKRRILDEVVPDMDGMTSQIHGEFGVGALDESDYESLALLGLLALPYADHPDYRDAWRP